MDSLRIEIEAELKRTRLDKTRLYSLLLKLIDNRGAGGVGPTGPRGAPGAPGAPGIAGPACECKCVITATPKKTVAAPVHVPVPEPKKAVAKKKVVSSA